MLRTVASAFVALLLCAAAGAASPEPGDWPQYRGPRRDGKASGATLEPWPETGPKVSWKRPAGSGFSQLAVRGDVVVTGVSDDTQEYVVRLDPASGAEMWRTPLGPVFVSEFGNGPRSTPTIDGDRVYALGANGTLLAVSVADGKPIWGVSLTERFGVPVPRFGYSTSPLVLDGRVLLEVGTKPPPPPVPEGAAAEGEGAEDAPAEPRAEAAPAEPERAKAGAIVALDAKTGETVWSALSGPAAYASPVVIDFGGLRHIVFNRGADVTAIDTAGKPLWSYELEEAAIAMPVDLGDGRVFVSAMGDTGCAMLRLKKTDAGFEVSELWKNRNMRNHFNSTVLHDGHLYGFDNATLKCLSADTGELVWAKRGLGKGSLALAGNRLVVLGDQGQLLLVEASPAGYRELASFQALEGKSWTAPTVARGRIWLRNLEQMACIDPRG